MRAADSAQLAEICSGLLTCLCNEADTTAAMQILDYASREEDLCRRLLAVDSFRAALETADGGHATGDSACADLGQHRIEANCRSALRLLRTRSTLRTVHEFECENGGPVLILENRAFGGQSTCKQDGTLKTGGIVWDAAHCLVDLMQRLGPGVFRGKSVLELGAGCGYVGIVAARMGAIVTVTDRVDHIHHLQRNVELNGLEHSMRVAELEWEEPLAADIPPNFDWILASDCVYEEDSHRPLAHTLRHFTRPDGATAVLMSQETRSDKHTSFFLRGRRTIAGAHAASTPPSCEYPPSHPAGKRAEQDGQPLLHFVVKQVDAGQFERPAWCHESQEIRIFCLQSPRLACMPGSQSGSGASGGACIRLRELRQHILHCQQPPPPHRLSPHSACARPPDVDLDELD
jgi:2-polyprenyl-3-methyl-5-hydroxy-6-metoxy-1,4-benzoquinol methylase